MDYFIKEVLFFESNYFYFIVITIIMIIVIIIIIIIIINIVIIIHVHSVDRVDIEAQFVYKLGSKLGLFSS